MSFERPISPHLTIYRWLISNTISILHRLSGFSLSIVSLLLVLWLFSAAYSPNLYYDLHEFMASILGRLLLLGATFAFFFHLANGIRHLFWDVGMGYELKVMNITGLSVIAFTIIMTGASWFYAIEGGGTVPAQHHAPMMHAPIHEEIQGQQDFMPDEEAPYGSRQRPE